MLNSEDKAKKIGSPQKICRVVDLDGLEVVVRLQKPFEELAQEITMLFNLDFDVESNTFSLDSSIKQPDIEFETYGTCVVIEAWSDVTESVISHGIIASEGQTQEEFAFSVRYMMNNGSDEEWLEVLRNRGIDKVLKFACNNASAFVKDKVVKEKKK